MDILFTTMELAPRTYPSRLRVENIGYLPRKDYWIDWDFESYNFSLILDGRGRFESSEYTMDIEAPCVITQAPGTQQRYGPDAAGWTEIYLIYSRQRLAELESRGLWPPPAPAWKVRCAELFRDTMQFLINRMQQPQSIEQADYMDRLAEQCVLASLMPEPLFSESTPAESGIASVRRQVDDQPGRELDWKAMAASVHMSMSTFRRHWLKSVGVPPAAYLTRKRMEAAARLLATGKLSVNEIAVEVGYHDALHFSRVFRQHFQISPRSYRNSRQN